jgi:hypothetical protein
MTYTIVSLFNRRLFRRNVRAARITIIRRGGGIPPRPETMKSHNFLSLRAFREEAYPAWYIAGRGRTTGPR